MKHKFLGVELYRWAGLVMSLPIAFTVGFCVGSLFW